jgi:hypothetical protein
VIRWLIVLVLAAVAVVQAWPSETIRHAPGVLAPREPAQAAIADARPIAHKGFSLLPLASFEVEARVLSVERYWIWREATLSPIDFALGWGPMSDQQIVDRLEISQGNRYYHFRWRGSPPLPARTLGEHSANMHLIPASPAVWRTLKAVRPGHVVRLGGSLVSASTSDGWRWDSSLTRTDSGPGACELVWVETATFTRR